MSRSTLICLLLKKNPKADAKTPAPTAGSAVALGVGCLTYGKDDPSAVAYDFFTIAGGTGTKSPRSTPNATFTPLAQRTAQAQPVLANTGSNSSNTPLALSGTALLALGAGLVLWSRRSRTVTAALATTAASE
jgi:LPXTG-motif cell wall-anchored protein